MELVTKKIKIIMPVCENYKLYSPIFDFYADEIDSGIDLFRNDYFCKGDVLYTLIEYTARYLWDLKKSLSSTSNHDAIRYTNVLTNEHYEIRVITKTTYFGPATSTGKDREPVLKRDNREKFEKHHNVIISKINFIDRYIFCDINYPPFAYFFEVPRNLILYLFEKGDLKYQQNNQRKDLIKNKVTRKEFYKLFLNSDDNPNHIEKWIEANPMNMSKKSIKDNSNLIVHPYSNSQMKDSSKSLRDKGFSLMHFEGSNG